MTFRALACDYDGTLATHDRLGADVMAALEEARARGIMYRAIIDTAAAKQCDLIVMASHGRRGVAALVLGSETTKVLTHSKIPVLVCR